MGSEKDISVVRYVDLSAAKSIISANSTFLLRSLQYYQDLEILSNDKTRGDRKEGEVEFSDGSGSSWNPQDWLISCWSKYEGGELNWESIDKKNCLAIVSTRQRVKSMLGKACGNAKPSLMDKEVTYADTLPAAVKPHIDLRGCGQLFYKREEFTIQNEYRFALHLPLWIETLILYVDPCEYIDQICVKPDNGVKKCINHYILCAQGGYGFGADFDWRGKLTKPLL